MHSPNQTTLAAAIAGRCRPHGADDNDVERIHRACVAFCGAAEVGHATLARRLAAGLVVAWWLDKLDEHGERYLAVDLTEAGHAGGTAPPTLLWHCRVYDGGVGYGLGHGRGARAFAGAATAPGDARRIAAAQTCKQEPAS